MSGNTTKGSTAMQRFSIGDNIKIELPEKSQMSKYNNKLGTIKQIIRDDLDAITGDPRDAYCYIIEFEDGELFRARDSDMSYN